MRKAVRDERARGVTRDAELAPQEFDSQAVLDAVNPHCRVAVLSLHTSPVEQPGTGDSGGLNVYVRKVAEAMGRNGVLSDIYTRKTSPNDPEVRTLAPGVRVLAVPVGPARRLSKERLPHLAQDFAEEVARRALVEGPYDVVHAHYWLSGMAGGILSERWGVPLIASFHTLARVKELIGDTEPAEPPVRTEGETYVINAAARVIASTELERAQLTELYGAAPDRVAVVPPGIDLELFRPEGRDAARRRMGFGAEPTVVFVGRLQPLKGAHVALQTMARLRRMVPDARLVIAGDDSPRGRGERARLRLTARRLGIGANVTFMDPLPHEELPTLYRAADALILPSASESFGLVALEASACETPVVASAVGGLRLIVRDGETGYLVPGRDPDGFAAALSRILADPRVRRRLGGNGVRLARRYPWSATARGLLEAYASVMACPGVRRVLERVH